MSHTGNRVIFRGRDVGHMDGDIFITERKPEHVMIKYKGFGVSIGVLDFVILQLGAKKIRFEYKNQTIKRIYEYDIMSFVLSDKQWIDKTTDGKEDVQKFVSLEEQDWSEIKDGLPYFARKKDADEPV